MIALFIVAGLFIFCIVCTVLYFNLKAKVKRLEMIAGQVQDGDKYLSEKRAEGDAYLADRKSIADKQDERYNNLLQKSKELSAELKAVELNIVLNSVSIDAYENLKSDEVKNQLALLKNKQNEIIKSGNAVETFGSSTAKKKVVDAQAKQILRCFNAETVSIIENVTIKNIDASRAKIQRSFDALNKMFAVDNVRITQEFLATKFEELSMVYAYQIKQAEEAEQRKAIREQMVEEEKVRREIERAKQKIEKDEAQFKNEEKKLMNYLQSARDDAERRLYMDKIKELQDKLAALEKEKEDVTQREQNARAGFVYIISNIGSFGENVYKIGMTRRLEPMDRIAELSSASVPFPFDVHALIFSDDAPGLENTLHQYFDKMRINKVNPRKEFFRVNLEEIKQLVKEKHNATARFVDVPDAVEYRETLRLENKED